MTPKEEQKHTDLLPCPFCGGEVEWGTRKVSTGTSSRDVGVRVSINCTTIGCRHSAGTWHMKEHAAAHWNRRTDTRKADCHEELAALEDLLEAATVTQHLTDIEYPELAKAQADRLVPDTVLRVAIERAQAFLACATNHQSEG